MFTKNVSGDAYDEHINNYIMDRQPHGRVLELQPVEQLLSPMTCICHMWCIFTSSVVCISTCYKKKRTRELILRCQRGIKQDI
jgi:hypothetical protein